MSPASQISVNRLMSDSAWACTRAAPDAGRDAPPSRRAAPASWTTAAAKIPAYTMRIPAATAEMGLLTGRNTQYSARAATTSSATTRNRQAMPAEQSLVRHDVLGRPGGVAGRDAPVDREVVAEARQGGHEQQRDPGDEAGLADLPAGIRPLLEGRRRRVIGVAPAGWSGSVVRHRGPLSGGGVRRSQETAGPARHTTYAYDVSYTYTVSLSRLSPRGAADTAQNRSPQCPRRPMPCQRPASP